MARLLDRYRSEMIANLQKTLGRKNVLAVPKVEKVVVSMGVGRAIQDRKILEEAVEHLTQITGQKPQITRSKHAISGFRLRQGMEVGCRVTIRGQRMYEFLDRLISIALPRVRDFRGLNPTAFDGHGNYSFGLTEQLVFPEINADKLKNIQGMNITMVTSAETNADGLALLKELGLPFRKD